MTLFKRILRVLGLVTLSEHEALLDQYKTQSLTIDGQEEIIRKSDELIEKLKEQIEDLTQLCVTKTAEAEEYRNKDSTNDIYVKEVQKQLSKAFHEDDLFGFHRSIAIPGSTSITSYQIDEEVDRSAGVLIAGRTIVDDQTTQKINEAKTLHEKLNIVIAYMAQYNILNRIARELLCNGALAISLAYNENCTCYEAYYTAVADDQTKKGVLRFHQNLNTYGLD